MALTRSTFNEKVRTMQVQWEDETVEVGVYPGRYTPALVDEVNQAVKDAENAEDDTQRAGALDVLGSVVGRLLASWDVYEDDAAMAAGERLPITPENIASLPMSFSTALMGAIGEVVRPPARKG